MPSYRIHRLKDHARQHFRWAPHVSGRTAVKHRDYQEPQAAVEASTPYAAWFALRDADAPLAVGDLIETEAGALFILKYVGFEEAEWLVAEPPPGPEEPPGGMEAANAAARG